MHTIDKVNFDNNLVIFIYEINYFPQLLHKNAIQEFSHVVTSIMYHVYQLNFCSCQQCPQATDLCLKASTHFTLGVSVMYTITYFYCLGVVHVSV
jgi:D-alanyl-D-alanine dipeptidase